LCEAYGHGGFIELSIVNSLSLGGAVGREGVMILLSAMGASGRGSRRPPPSLRSLQRPLRTTRPGVARPFNRQRRVAARAAIHQQPRDEKRTVFHQKGPAHLVR